MFLFSKSIQHWPFYWVVQIFKTALMSVIIFGQVPDTYTAVRHGQCLAKAHYNVMIHKLRNYKKVTFLVKQCLTFLKSTFLNAGSRCTFRMEQTIIDKCFIVY